MAMNKTRGTRKRILLVDDEAGFVTVLAKRMSRRGFSVTTAGNGADAIKILRKLEFDMALLDLKMEGLSGIDVLKVFKMMAPELPVIILTGHGCQEAAAEGMKRGAVDYICKPYDFDALLEKILTTIGKE